MNNILAVNSANVIFLIGCKIYLQNRTARVIRQIVKPIMNLIYFRSFARASSILYKRLNNFSTRNVTNSIISPSVRISKLFENDGPIKISEWNNIRMSFLQTENSTENNVDHLILDFCERNNQAIDNALSYVDFLKVNQIYTNVQLQSKVIKLCCQKLKSESILPSQETKIIKL